MARKPKKKTFLECLTGAGLTDELVAARIAEILNTGPDKLKLEAAKLYLVLKGDLKNDKGSSATIFTSGPTMMIVGATKDRIRALREGPPIDYPPSLESSPN